MPIKKLTADSDSKFRMRSYRITPRVKCCEVFFETLNAPALCVKTQSELAIFGSGITTGLSVDFGEDMTEINPIYEGGSVTYANMLTNIAGRQIKGFIQDSLEQRGINLGSDSEFIVKDIFHKYTYVTEYCTGTKEQYMKQYTLPSGEVIDVSDEAFFSGELCFQPELVMGETLDKTSIQDAIVTAVMKCQEGIQSEMFENIVIHGGSASLPGYIKRLKRELEEILQQPVNIIESSECYAVAWMGGAVFAGMLLAPKIWISKKQFEDQGEKLVRNMFL